MWTCWVRTKVDWVVEAAEALLGQTSILAPSGKQNGGTCQENRLENNIAIKTNYSSNDLKETVLVSRVKLLFALERGKWSRSVG